MIQAKRFYNIVYQDLGLFEILHFNNSRSRQLSFKNDIFKISILYLKTNFDFCTHKRNETVNGKKLINITLDYVKSYCGNRITFFSRSPNFHYFFFFFEWVEIL